jgi:hypothetical protein
VIFVGDGINASSNYGEVEEEQEHPVHIPEFKHRLVFDGYQLGGVLANVEHGTVIEIPRLKPETVCRFLHLLSSPEGQHAAFRLIDNLVTAYVFATAIKDKTFQQMLITRIYNVACNHYKVGNRGRLYEKLLQKVAWAWNQDTEGRTGLRPVFTMSLAYVSTSPKKLVPVTHEKSKKPRKRSGQESEEGMRESSPQLNLATLVDLQRLIDHNQWWTAEVLPDFVEKCLQLVDYNKRDASKWKIVPVGTLMPDDVSYDLTDE